MGNDHGVIVNQVLNAQGYLNGQKVIPVETRLEQLNPQTEFMTKVLGSSLHNEHSGIVVTDEFRNLVRAGCHAHGYRCDG